MKEKMKIAFIGTNDYPIPSIHGGAIQTLVTSLLDKNEEKNNFDIDVYTVFSPELENVTKEYKKSCFFLIHNNLVAKIYLFLIRVLRRITHNAVKYKSIYMKKIFAIIKRKKYDAIIFETTDKEVVQLPEEIRRKSKIIFHIHADYLNNFTDRINEITNKVDYFVGVSDFISQKLEDIDNINKKHIVTLKNAIDVNSICNKADKMKFRTKIRKKYGFTEDDIVLIFCGRLSPEKGCLELIKALKNVQNVKLMIIGGNNFSSNKKTEYVKKLYEEAVTIKERVVFVGYVSHENVQKYMSAADIGVVPSVCNESCSLTLLEYRSIGLPTIATNIGGIPEYCSERTTRLVDLTEQYIDDLSASIKEVCMDQEKMKNMKACASLDMNDFGYEAYYDRFSEMINEIVRGNKCN